MKAGWQVKALGEVCEVVGGGTPPKDQPQYYGGQIPWATVRDMNVEVISETEHTITEKGLAASSSKLIPAGEVILASRVGLGKICMLAQDTAINQDLRGVIPSRSGQIDRKFLFYWLKSISQQIIDAGSGATVQGVKLPFLKGLQIPLPPLAEQKQIVAVLDAAFAGLSRARAHVLANLENLSHLRQSTLSRAFAGQLSTPHGTAPKTGWQIKALGEVCTIKPSKSLSRKDLIDSELVSFVPMGDLGELQQSFEPLQERPLGEVYSGYTYFAENDVLVAKITPCFENGKLGIARGLTNGVGFGSSEFVPIRSLGAVLPEYIFYYLFRDEFRETGAKIMTGAVGHKRVPEDYFRQLEIPLPTIAEQREIVTTLDAAFDAIATTESHTLAKLADLDALRAALLQKAFAGELT